MILIDKLKDYKIILASKSPRRQQLLKECGIVFEIADNYEVEEEYPKDMPVGEVAAFLSALKSNAYPDLLAANEILITADTVVIADGHILGKPADHDQAVSMLDSLSGKSHTVMTGVTIRNHAGHNSFTASTEVWFRQLNEEEIEYYVNNFKPFDKAGAYGIQEWIGYVGINRIEGSFYNVMGLPVQMLYVELEKLV